MTLNKKPFENFVGKGGNVGNQHFLLSPQYFLLFKDEKSSILSCHLQMLSIWSSPEFCRLVKCYSELNVIIYFHGTQLNRWIELSPRQFPPKQLSLTISALESDPNPNLTLT